MQTKVNGSIIMLMLMVIASITIIMITTIKAVTIFYNLALERKEYLCQTAALESLVCYGIAVGQMIYRDKHDQQQYHQTFQSWPSLKKGNQAVLTVIVQPPEYKVKAQIVDATNPRTIERRIVLKNDTWVIEP
jgi:hypothetical protein